MTTPEHEGAPLGGDALASEDAVALDALMEAGFEVSRVAEPLRPRAQRIAALLGLLDAGDAADAALVDATLLRVLRAGSAEDASLSRQDQDALESWVMHGYRSERVPLSLRDRARRHEALAALVTAGEASDDGLVERTVSRVREELESRTRRMTLEPSRRPMGVRLADLVSVAAVLLIGVAVAWPVLTAMREQGRRQWCSSNLAGTGTALASYAASNADALPAVSVRLDGGTWWNVGRDPASSNSANLYHLVRGRYLSIDRLACPGNPNARTEEASPDARDWRSLEEVSYSYQNQFGARQPHWEAQGPVIVLADRSPVVLRSVRREPINAEENAPNHNGRGQHALSTDGAVAWLTSPTVASGDNIWLPRPIEAVLREIGRRHRVEFLSGKEAPADADDAFLAP